MMSNLSFRPGSIIITKAGHHARVIWADATKQQLGVFFIKDRGGSFGVIDYTAVAHCDNSSPWTKLNQMSDNEIKERLRPLVNRPAKKSSVRGLTKKQQNELFSSAVNDLPLDIQKQLRDLGVIK